MSYSLRKGVRDTPVQYASSRKRIKTLTLPNQTSQTPENRSDESSIACPFCDQKEDEVKSVSPESSAVCERAALYLWIYHDKLNLSDLDETKKHPVMSIMNYAVYDREKHLCSIDSNYYDGIEGWMVLLKGCVLLTSSSGEILKKHVEDIPIHSWYIKDDEDQVCVVLSSTFVDYVLLNEDTEYSDIMSSFFDKLLVTRATMVYLLKNYAYQPSYEGLIAAISQTPKIMTDDKNLTKEIFLDHLLFICEEILSHEQMSDNTLSLLSIPFMQSLMNEFNINLTKSTSRKNTKGFFEVTKATTTYLVRKTFENIFSGHLDDVCISKDCNNSESVLEKQSMRISKLSLPTAGHALLSSLAGEKICTEKINTYYSSIVIKMISFKCGDFIEFKMSKDDPFCIGKVVYMWVDTVEKNIYFHVQIFIHGHDTILGDIAELKEIFLTDKCIKVSIRNVFCHVNVVKKVVPNDWSKFGDKSKEDVDVSDSEKSYFYQKKYNEKTARFEDMPDEPSVSCVSNKHRYCTSCHYKNIKFISNIPFVTKMVSKYIDDFQEWTYVMWKGSKYKSGDAVFLAPSTFRFDPVVLKTIDKKIEKDESVFTEYYRYNEENTVGLNSHTREPFCVGYISAILAKDCGPLVVPQNIYLEVYVMYRPENTSLPDHHTEDLNLVYWSDRKEIVNFSRVTGSCNLAFIDNITSWTTVEEWSLGDNSRFYFKNCYDVESKKLFKVPRIALTVGEFLKLKHQNQEAVTPLRALDIFAGCGGLSKGLHESGIIEKPWAVEQDPSAATAYQLNMPDSVVFTEDCNTILKRVMRGDTFSSCGKPLPKPGDVEILCGGPPCQGFSGMNRFTTEESATFKNSLIVTFLSYCDFYRPKYIIMENVRNFAFYNKGIILKLTLNCLLKIGYQCTFGILQAGNFGVPQTRRRFIILAAAPECKLPHFPEPTHVFSRKACWLSVTVDGKRFDSPCEWEISAPKRTCTIRDAISDLPPIANGNSEDVMDYINPPQSQFQRLARHHSRSNELRDHICKSMGPLMYARICHVPINSEADWRDIPNVMQTLSDGTECKKLIYTHDDIKNGRGVNGSLRGVCACAAGKLCRAEDKQNNTLIPWFLPHSANRTNNWNGVCGRLTWDGYFSTTITNPEPLGKQGRVLHPNQQRVVSVRECARSQGFSDSFHFVGTISEKYQQIGNAVPPTLAVALGQEIHKLMCKSPE